MSGRTRPVLKGAVPVAPLSPLPHLPFCEFVDVLAKIENGGYTVTELTTLRQACQRALQERRKAGMIMGGAVIQPGDRVMINDSYHYKTMRGVTGVVEKVTDHAHSSIKYVWITVTLRPDSLPKRVPRYAVDGKGLVNATADSVTLI